MNRYLPDVLQGIAEFSALMAAEQPEFESLRTQINALAEEACAETASADGIARFESALGLTVSTTDLELRRLNVLSALNNQVPYTMAWLRNKLASVFGEGAADAQLDADGYEVSVEVDSSYADALDALYTDLRKAVPANMILHANVTESQSFTQYTAFSVHTADDIYL